MRIWIGVFFLLIGVLILAPAPGAAQADNIGGSDPLPEQPDIPDSDSPGETSESGATVPVTPEQESEIISEAESANAVPGVNIGPIPDTVVQMDTGSEEFYVLTSTEDKVGNAEVTGYDLSVDAFPGVDSSIFYANSFDYTDDVHTATADDVFDDPASYRGQVVRLDLDAYSQSAVAAHALEERVTARYTAGVNGLVDAPTDPGVDGLGTFDDAIPVDPESVVPHDREAYLGGAEDAIDPGGITEPVLLGLDRSGYVGSGPATVDVAIVGSPAQLYVEGVAWDGDSVANLSAIGQGAHDGEFVTVEADRVETSVSIKSTLEQVAECGSDWLVVPSIGCAPAVTDVVGHGGVVYEGSGANRTIVPYVGVSNAIQTTPVDTSYGRVAVTGRVVNADEVPSTLDADRAIAVADIEPVGGGSGNASSAVEAMANGLGSSIKTSLYTELRNHSDVDLPTNGSQPEIVNVSGVPSGVNVTESVTVNVTVANDGWAAYNETVRLENESTVLASTPLGVSAGTSLSVSLETTLNTTGNTTLIVGGNGVDKSILGTVNVTLPAKDGSSESDGNESDGNDGDNDESDGDGDEDGGGGLPALPAPDDDSSPDAGQDGHDEDSGETGNESDENGGSDGDSDRGEENGDGTTDSDDLTPEESSPGNDSNSNAQNQSDDQTRPAGDGDSTPGFTAIAAVLALLGSAGILRHR